MSEPGIEPAPPPAESGAAAPAEAPSTVKPAPRWREAALALAGALLLAVVLVATAPFWAALLPWGGDRSQAEKTLTAKLDRLSADWQQQRQRAERQQSALGAALQQLDGRIAALEAKPAASAEAVAALRGELTRLVGAAADADRRIAALDNSVHRQTAALGDLGSRLATLDKTVNSRAATDAGDTALLLDLLQIRAALEVGRPFAAAYDALARLAHGRPELADAVTALSDPAKTGIATRAVLAAKLHELGGAVTAKPSPAAQSSWSDAALARLGRLVTIRRIDDGGAKTADAGGPAAAVAAAERALAGGDLAGAVGALDKLAGVAGEAATPWIRLAKQRLAAEAALRHIEASLAARLGSPAAAAPPG